MIVMKFGGTSVQDAATINAVIEIVGSRRSRSPVVVAAATAVEGEGAARERAVHGVRPVWAAPAAVAGGGGNQT